MYTTGLSPVILQGIEPLHTKAPPFLTILPIFIFAKLPQTKNGIALPYKAPQQFFPSNF